MERNHPRTAERKGVNMTDFDQWMEKVDYCVAMLFCGLSTSDLPDVDFWGLFDGGDTPEEAALFVIENAQT